MYASSTGQLVAWVQIPALSPASDTAIYLYYGNAAASSQQQRPAVWDSTFKMVLHGGDGTTLNLSDSTITGNNATNNGTNAAAGKINGGVHSGGGYQNGLSFTSPTGIFDLNTSTYTTWVNVAACSNPQGQANELISIGARSLVVATDCTIQGAISTSASYRTAYSTTTISAGSWHLLTETYDSSDNLIHIFLDGAEVSYAAHGTGSGTSSDGTNVSLMYPWFNNYSGNFYGSIDEIRIANVVRSAGWIVTEFNNQNAPSTFYSISGQQSGGGGSSGAASFVRTDTTTGGSWKGVYGVDGYNIINDTANYPAYVTATPSGNSSWTWTTSSTDARALQEASSTTNRIAACWDSSSSFTIDLNFHDSNTHQVALYLLDWDNYNGGRSERVEILDANNTVLDSRSVSGFGGGEYLLWNLSGHVVVRFVNLNGNSNALVNGLLFGTAAATGAASFVQTDTTTSGSWKGVYGVEGYNIINDTASYPAYVTATPSGNSSCTWAVSTTDARALQKASSTTDRLAACWFSSGSFSIDLNFHDSSPHQVALYLLDWDNYNGGRSERVDILDANNTVLDSRSVSNFVGGEYVVWNLSGHVVVRVVNLNGNSNAVVSGLLFGAGGSIGPPTNISVSPSSGSGASQTFAFVGASGNGYSNLNVMQMLFSWGVDGRQACYIQYWLGSNTVQLVGDDGVSPQSATMGASVALDNSQCHIDVGNSSASGSGANLTVSVAVTFKASYVGSQNTYMVVTDNAGVNSSWQLMGTWTGYPASPALPSIFVSPPSGIGMSQTFSFHTSDVNGYKYIVWESMLLNSSLNGAGACYIGYIQVGNNLSLANDAGNGATYLTPGVAGTASNSQCTINAGASSVIASGNDLYVNVVVAFAPGFSGAKNWYTIAHDRANNETGWVPWGSWTVGAAQATGDLITNYTYDLYDNLTQVSMPRSTGVQTRTFIYSGKYLMSATNPENGTVSYSYTGNGKINSKIDAKGQQIVYTYDAYTRLTQIQRFPTPGNEDICQRTTYSYDTNPIDASFSVNALGRVTAVQYGVPMSWLSTGGGCPTLPYALADQYSYTPAGLVTNKRLSLTADVGSQSTALKTATLDTSQTYDGQGRVQTVTYPDGKAYTYAYDTVSRPISLTDNQSTPVTWVNNVQYGLSGELLQISYAGYTETRTYNSRLQLTAVGSMEYRYSPTQNNGQITQQKDWSSGEEVTYAYDSLQRLISAVTTDPSWGQSFTYDGFGNLTSQTQTKGYAPSMNSYVDPATNRIGGYGYDANGNMISTGAYDVENRLVSVPQTHPDGTNGAETYGYATDNKRVYKRTVDGTEELYFYGISGQKLGTYRPFINQAGVSISAVDTNLYFGSRTIVSRGVTLIPDRLGSNRAGGSRYFPYGMEQQVTAQDKDKFATYYRDATTTLDYAQNRYYASFLGRFISPDPSIGSNAADPSSWNKYAYVQNNPVKFHDPQGLSMTCEDCGEDGEVDCQDGFYWDSFSGFCKPYGGVGFPTGGGTTTQSGGGSSGGTTFASAQSAFQRSANDIANKKTFKKPCDADFTTLGTTARAVQSGAASAVFLNGVGSTVALSSLYTTAPDPNVASAGSALTGTIGGFISSNKGTVAVSQLGGNNIYLNASLINPNDYFQNVAIVLHEILHNVTGLTDGDIQRKFGLSEDGVSDNITKKLLKDCF